MYELYIYIYICNVCRFGLDCYLHSIPRICVCVCVCLVESLLSWLSAVSCHGISRATYLTLSLLLLSSFPSSSSSCFVFVFFHCSIRSLALALLILRGCFFPQTWSVVGSDAAAACAACSLATYSASGVVVVVVVLFVSFMDVQFDTLS